MFADYLRLPRAIHLLCLGTFVNRAGTFIIPFLTLYLTDRLGLGVTFATRTMGLYGLGSILGATIGGHLADRIGRRAVMLFALFGAAAILIVFSFQTSGPAIMAATFVFALVGDMYRPAASAMIADLVEPERRPHAFGLMYLAINLGFAFGPVIGSQLARYSFKWLFYGDAFTSCLYGVLVIWLIRETLPARGSSVEQPGTAIPADASFGSAARRIARDTVFLRFVLATLFVALCYSQAFSTFPLFLGAIGIDEVRYGRIIALNGVLIVLLQIPITTLITRFDRGRVLVLAAGLTAVGFGLNALAHTPWQFALTVVVWTIGEIMQAPLMAPIVSEMAPTELRARYMGVLSMAHSSANMIGAPLGGLILERLGGRAVWPTAMGVALLASVMYFSVRRQVAASQRPHQSDAPA